MDNSFLSHVEPWNLVNASWALLSLLLSLRPPIGTVINIGKDAAGG